ncbi:hypothetical protein ABIA99_007556 [Bradyrhizobium sp. LB12.1]|uniref:hypothetical protein n=1 Tax=Bradyrhizobium sp. LB12.1 TaxID=3156327 RepID=UPI00339AFD07
MVANEKKVDEAVAAYLAEPYISAKSEIRKPSGWHFTCTGFLGGRSADWVAPGWAARRQQNPDRLKPFREIDRAEWFDLEAARSKILSGKIELIDRLETRLHR